MAKAFENSHATYVLMTVIIHFYFAEIYRLSFVSANQGIKGGLYHNIIYHNKSVAPFI